MNLSKNYRSLLLAGSVLALVSACSEADVESVGSAGPVTIGGTGGTTTPPTGATSLDFVPAGGCPTGTQTLNQGHRRHDHRRLLDPGRHDHERHHP